MINRRKIAFTFISIIMLSVASIFLPVPEPLFDDPYATVLKANDGSLLGARIASDGQWRFPDSYRVPAKFEKAILTFEDQYFYKHWGVNPVSLWRALVRNIREKRIVAGGSTITMQLARLHYGNKPRTLSQKLREIWLSLRLEVYFAKEELLQLYVNHAPFGGNVVGLPAASWRYFGRDPELLSWAEYAGLAVLPNAPGIIYPGTNDQQLLEKRNHLLRRLQVTGIISKSEYQLALLEPVPGAPVPLPNKTRHLVNRARAEGHDGEMVSTTIDPRLQEQLNERVQQYGQHMQAKQIHNAAALIMEISTGKVLAYTGNIGNKNDHGSEVDIISSRRSPGSLLKPFLYALAIDEGLITPWQLLPDIPLYYRGFAPQNFDKQYNGAVPANLALRSSLNVPFVHLLKEYGYEKFHTKLQHAGMQSLDQEPGYYGLTLILGGGEVTMWEIATLYAGLARSAQGHTERSDWQMSNYHNEFEKKQEYSKILSSAAAFHTVKAMQELRRPDEESNWQRFGSSRPIAWKTGTSYGHKDAWSVGLNAKYVVAVWLGNADGEGRADLVGVSAAAPLMFRVFNFLDGDAQFSAPMGEMKTFRICQQSGFKANEACEATELIYASNSLDKTLRCPYHKYIFLDERQRYQVNASCYPTTKMVRHSWFALPPAQEWYYRRTNAEHLEMPAFKPGCLSDDNQMEMIYPRNFTKVYIPIELNSEQGRVVFEAAHRNPGTKIFWHLDDEFVGTTTSEHKLGLYPPKGNHRLHLVDEFGQELTVNFAVLNESKSGQMSGITSRASVRR